MIAADQPTIFGESPVVGLSSRRDGDMRFTTDDAKRHDQIHFLDEVSVELTQVTRLQASYDTTDFARYITLDDSYLGEGMIGDELTVHADAMVVTRPDHAIFLSLADCVGAVIYDEVAGVLMVSHLGRHSTEIDGARQSVAYLTEQFDSNPADLKVWLSPAVGRASYPLTALDGKGLHEAIIEQLTSAGVPADGIEASAVDTALNADYFSHSEHLAGRQTDDGRFAVVAMMRDWA